MESENFNRLQFFPVPMFAIIMGLSGLTIVFQKASSILNFPAIMGSSFLAIDSIVFAIIALFYLLKFFKYPEEVKSEFNHKIRINFFAAISISMLLLAVAYRTTFLPLSLVLFLLGVVLHTYLTFYIISFWINNSFEINHSNPAWFIPIVGNVLIPLAGEGFAPHSFLLFYFSIGMFFWIVLFTITFYRIIFHNQLPIKFMPTLFILIAPPAIGFIAYVKLSGGELDLFAEFLYSLALFFTLLISFMYKNFLKLKYFISWWAFTFPSAAITIATMLMYKLSGSSFYEYLSYILIFVTTLIITIVSFETISHMRRREICVQED